MKALRSILLAASCAACAGEGGGGGAADGGPDAGIDPVTVTIRQVQDPVAAGWVAAGTWVRIEDVVVTARGNATDDFTVQDDRADEPGWSGVFVAVDDPDGALPVPIQGDRVTLVARVEEVVADGLPGSETRLVSVASIEVLSNGAAVPEPALVTTAEVSTVNAAREEELEGVLVRVAGPLEVVDVDTASGDLALASGLVVGALFHAPETAPGPGDVYQAVAGPLGFERGAPRVLPRGEGDRVGLVVAAHIVGLDPAVAAVAPGHARALRVLLDAATPSDVTVCLASSHPATAAPSSATVIVPAGASEAELEVDGVAAAAAPAIIRAWRAASGAGCGAPPGAAVAAHIAVTQDRIAGPGDLLFNEVLSDPPGVDAADVDGDASCDGLRDSDDDEFLELVNVTDEVLDLSGVRVRDKLPAEVERHVFAAGTRLDPGEAILVFGAPVGQASAAPWCAALAGLQVVSASAGTGLHLNNAGDTVTLLDAGGAVLGSFQYSALVGAHNQSLTRDPDLGADVVLYGSAGEHLSDRAFTPGTRIDGSSFP